MATKPTEPKRRPGRPAIGRGELIGIRWRPDLLAGIDKYARKKKLDRGDALRQIVQRFLGDQGWIRL
jgi:hypothetical protein